MLPLLTQMFLPAGALEQDLAEVDLTATAEALIRSAVANCSPELLIPRLPSFATKLGAEIHFSHLPPSLRQRVTVLDARDRIWRAVRSYFEPVMAKATPEIPPMIASLACDLHLLILATRTSAQIHLDLNDGLEILHLLGNDPNITGEAAARVAILEGAFRFLEPLERVPGLTVSAGNETAFRDRIEEILEDAYLAEASSMRQFLCFDSNAASVRRDLRSLLRSIVRSRKWAKGAVTVAEQRVALPSVTVSAIGTVVDALDLDATDAGPIVLDTFNPPWLSVFRVEPGVYEWESLIRPLEQEVTESQISFYFSSHEVHGDPSLMTRPSWVSRKSMRAGRRRREH